MLMTLKMYLRFVLWILRKTLYLPAQALRWVTNVFELLCNKIQYNTLESLLLLTASGIFVALIDIIAVAAATPADISKSEFRELINTSTSITVGIVGAFYLAACIRIMYRAFLSDYEKSFEILKRTDVSE